MRTRKRLQRNTVAGTHLAYARVNTPGDPLKNLALRGFLVPETRLWYNGYVPRRFPFITTFGLFVIIAVLYAIGLYFKLLWQIWWYDILLHTLGGVLISYVFMELIKVYGYQFRKVVHMFIPAIAAALVIGLLWELFELISGATFVSKAGYKTDTIIDIICDITGALIGVFISYKKHE